MQTFLPYPDFVKSAKCLDNKRLGKQRVEAWTIYRTLVKIEEREDNTRDDLPNDYVQKSKEDWWKCKCGKFHKGFPYKCLNNKIPWEHHPIVKMWKGYEASLSYYGIRICEEWINRGFKDSMLSRFKEEARNYKVACCPEWLGNPKFHASHRSNLLRKNPKWYGKFGWTEKNDLPYIWII